MNGAKSSQDAGSTAPIGVAPSMEPLKGAVMDELRARLFGHRRPRVGRYELMELIGEGSFGAVHRAHDPQLDRQVAIKLLRHDNPEALFAEAKRAAQLAHPNIVAVHDVGLLDEGGAFLVMDLVEGPTLREWLEAPRSPREIVAMFSDAGRGLAAAHDAGLVHRDFKPANVLVSQDRAMVADFGLAARVRPEDIRTLNDHESTSNTQGSKIVGTPRYMAPELFVTRPADARSDQYAFCLALREALTDTRVFAASDIDGQYESKCSPLPRWPRGSGVSGRLRAIVDRGLSLSPELRWPSMHELLAALDRTLARRRTSRFVIGGLLGSAVALAVMSNPGAAHAPCESPRHAPGADLLWGEEQAAAVQERLGHALPEALETTWPRLDHALAERSAAWAEATTRNCEATYVEHTQGKDELALRGSCLEAIKAEHLSTVEVLTSADAGEIARAIELVAALPDPDRCDDVPSLTARYRTPDEPAQREAVARQRRTLVKARVLRRAGRLPDSERLAREARDQSQPLGFAPLLTEARLELGITLDHLGTYDEAEVELRLSLEQALALDLPTAAVAAASTLSLLVGQAKDHPDEAESLAAVARSISQRAEVNAGTRAGALHNHAILLRRADRLSEAESMHRQALALREQPAEVLESSEALAVVLAAQRRLTEASALLDTVLREREELFGPLHPDIANTHINLGWIVSEQGRPEQAIPHFEAAIASLTAAFGPRYPAIAVTRSNLGAALAMTGEFDRAVAETQAALELEGATHGEQHPDYAAALGNLGYMQYRAGQFEQARRSLERAMRLEGCETEHAPARCSFSLSNLAQLDASEGHAERAEQRWRESIALVERSADTMARALKPLTGLGRLLLDQERATEALALLKRAAALLDEHEAAASSRAALQFELARAHEALGDLTLARFEADRAVSSWTAAGPHFADDLAKARALQRRLPRDPT